MRLAPSHRPDPSTQRPRRWSSRLARGLAGLRPYRPLLRRHALALVAIPVIAAALAYFLSDRHRPVYTARAQISYTNEGPGLGVTIPGVLPEDLATAKAVTLNQAQFLNDVRSAGHRHRSLAKLQSALRAFVDPRTDLVMIEARASSPTAAARLANLAARRAKLLETRRSRGRFAVAAQELGTHITAFNPENDPTNESAVLARAAALSSLATPVQIVHRARTPAAPTSPRPVHDALIALLLALPLAAVTALARERLDTRLHDARRASRLLAMPVLGQISVPDPAGEPYDATAEEFRILRANLSANRGPKLGGRVLAVTSPLADDATAGVAVALARSFAAAERDTIVVDCGLRRAAMSRRLGGATTPGLVELLTGRVAVDELVRPWPDEESPEARWLSYVPSGAPRPDAGDLLEHPPLSSAVERLRGRYDVVILDAGSLLDVADARMVVPHADDVLLCVRAASTHDGEAAAAKAALERLVPRPCGLVVLGSSAARASYPDVSGDREPPPALAVPTHA